MCFGRQEFLHKSIQRMKGMSNWAQRRRIQRMKRIVMIAAFVLLMLPLVFHIVLILQVRRLEDRIKSLEDRLVSGQALVSETATRETAAPSDSPGEKDSTTTRSDPEGEAKEEKGEVREVYLTFDDGPGIYTDQILDILAAYEVKATFFVTGENADRMEDTYRRIVEEGHSLGLHTYSHKYQEIYRSLPDFQADLNRLREYLREVTGQEVSISRFPGGSSVDISRSRLQELINWLNEEGIVYYDWNVSGGDADASDVSSTEIYENCMEGIRKQERPMILLHDTSTKRSTVEALPFIIEGILELGNTELLPIQEGTVPIQHVTSTIN